MMLLKKGQEIIDKKHKSDPVVIDEEKKVIPVKPILTDKDYHETCDKLEEIFNINPDFITNIVDDSKTSDKYVGALIDINELI